jgi:hypothetical protein
MHIQIYESNSVSANSWYFYIPRQLFILPFRTTFFTHLIFSPFCRSWRPPEAEIITDTRTAIMKMSIPPANLPHYHTHLHAFVICLKVTFVCKIFFFSRCSVTNIFKHNKTIRRNKKQLKLNDNTLQLMEFDLTDATNGAKAWHSNVQKYICVTHWH